MRTSDTALVVPSIRKDSFGRFVSEWRPTGLFNRVDLILMEDNPKRTFDVTIDMANNAENVTHFCWEDIDAYSWSHIVPRRSDTVRSFGYWAAYNRGYEYLMTLDDDCYPNSDYMQPDVVHKQMLNDRTKWFSTLNSVRPRGIPYYNLGKRQVHINHGIWTGVLDYDAPQQLVQPTPEVYTHDNRIVPAGAYHPFCGMNAMWRREAMPLSYHLLMGQALPKSRSISAGREYVVPNTDAFPVIALEKLPFDRFGDIWCGIIQKKICDALGWSVSTGTPYIHHDRASNPFTNLRKEANGIEVNEWFWEKIDAIHLDTYSDEDDRASAADLYEQVGFEVTKFGGEHSEYWTRLGSAMQVWAGLFKDR